MPHNTLSTLLPYETRSQLLISSYKMYTIQHYIHVNSTLAANRTTKRPPSVLGKTKMPLYRNGAKSTDFIKHIDGRPFLPRGAPTTRKNMKLLHKLIWQDLKALCTDPNHPQFSLYGGTGAKLCDDWQDFKTFIKELGPIPNGTVLSLDLGSQCFQLGACHWTQVERGNF